MIINLHGLAGSSENYNYNKVCKLYPDTAVYSPQIDYYRTSPETIMSSLTEIDQPIDLVIGNSFGGFFAYILCGLLKYKCVLTNPCIPPDEYKNGVLQDYPDIYLRQMNDMFSKTDVDLDDVYMILGTNDSVLSPSITRGTVPTKHLWEVPDDHVFLSKEFKKVFKEVLEVALGRLK